MAEKVKRHMVLVARWLIEDDENDDERDAIWDEMEQAEKDEANGLVTAIFGEWL